MAAGAWTLFHSAKVGALDGTIDFDTHDLKMIPLSSAYTPDLTHDELADVVAAEVTDGGNSMRESVANVAIGLVDVTGGNKAAEVTCDDVVMSANSAVGIKYVALYDDSAAGDPLISYFDTDTGQADGVTVTQLTIQSTGGLLRLT